MWSSDGRSAAFAAALVVALATARDAEAQPPAQGFDVERLYLSAPGGGWLVMDSLDLRGGLGGAVALTTGYAHDPLQVRAGAGADRVTVVSDDAFADFGFAATYDRLRLYLNFDAPLALAGQSGTVGGHAFTAPSLDPSSHPDTLSDSRVGLDARLLGGPKSPLRLGAGAQLYVPSGTTGDYDTDGTYRAMARVLAAGDIGAFTYAAQLGVHVRPLDDAATPGAPRGSELLFGVAEGLRLTGPGRSGTTALVVGVEAFGATAFRSFLDAGGTSLEALLSGRIEGTADDGAQLRIKLGAGIGIDRNLGTPEWRLVLSVETFDHDADRDHDGISDSKDACPETPGVKTKDPATNGCPAVRDDGAGPPQAGGPSGGR